MLQNAIAGYKDIFHFLRRPKDAKAPLQTSKQRIIRFVQVLILDLFVTLLIILLLYFFKKQGWLDSVGNQLQDEFFAMPIWLLLLLSVIIAPFIEELIFRHPLRFNSNIIIKVVIWFSTLFNKPGNHHNTKELLDDFWKRRFGLLFYTSAILFGLVHLTNYNLGKTLFYAIPILIAVQFFFGLFAGYIRVRYNFFMGFCLHASHNAILTLIPLIFIGPSTPILTHENQDYSIKIETVNYGMGNASIDYGNDTLSFQNIGLKNVISQLSGKKEILIQSNDTIKLKTRINLRFIDHQNKIKKKQKDTVLYYLTAAFKYSTRIKVKNQKVYWLKIVDSTKLKMNESESNSVKITRAENKIIMKNVTLTSMAGLVTSKLGNLTFCDTIKGRFDFTIPKKTKTLQDILLKDYGIKIIEKKKNIKYLF